MQQIQRWNWAPASISAKAMVNECYSSAYYREALNDSPLPLSDTLSMSHEADWQLQTTQGDYQMAANAKRY